MKSSDKLREIATRAKDDHYYLCKNVLGYTKFRPQPHKELSEFLGKKTGRRKKLVLMPRNSFKSSEVTVGFSVSRIVDNPDLRILIASETQKNAIKYVKEIKGHFESNVKFRALFGDWVAVDNTWRDNEFIVNRRKKVLKESTVTAGSLEKGTAVGMHYDIIFLDDVVSRNNVNTPEQLQKTIDFYKLLLSILDPEGEIYIIGTRWSPADLYGWLTDPESPETGQVDVFLREAIDDKGELLMPDVLSKEFLEEQRKTQGEYIFNCQYLNKAVSTELAAFKIDQIRYYDTPPPGLIYFITLDPAISLAERSDFSGIIVNGVDYKHDWYITEAIQVKAEPSDLVKIIFDLVQKYNPMCFAMEKFTLEQVLKINLLAEMEKRGVAFPIKDLPTDTRISKENRIRALQPRFENGQVYIKREHTALFHQLIHYPQVKHDDLLDALKSQLAITFPSPHSYEEQEKKYAHLPIKEQKIWEHVEKLGKKRKVHSKWMDC